MRLSLSTIHKEIIKTRTICRYTSRNNPFFLNFFGTFLAESEEDNMALRLWASSTANALKVSTAIRPQLSPVFSLSRCFSTVLDGLKYASSHEWVKHEGSVATIGITDHAQDHLGELVFVELPEPGAAISQGKSFGNVESVKATSEVNSPISGEVVEINSKLSEVPGLINTSPYEEGWMIKVKPGNPSELGSLMGPKEYTKFCEEEEGH